MAPSVQRIVSDSLDQTQPTAPLRSCLNAQQCVHGKTFNWVCTKLNWLINFFQAFCSIVKTSLFVSRREKIVWNGGTLFSSFQWLGDILSVMQIDNGQSGQFATELMHLARHLVWHLSSSWRSRGVYSAFRMAPTYIEAFFLLIIPWKLSVIFLSVCISLQAYFYV